MSFWDRLVEELRAVGENLAEWIVLIVVALIILIVGRWILKWVRRIVERVLGASALDGVWKKSGVSAALEPSGQTAASITATIVYAYGLIVLALIVARVLQLESIELLLLRLLAWVPLLILAAVIVIIAAAVANWTADLVRPFAAARGIPWLTWLIRIGIIVFGLLFALDLLDINFAEDVVKIVVAAAGIALAIAFGVGGIDAGKAWWAKYGTPSGIERLSAQDDRDSTGRSYDGQ